MRSRAPPVADAARRSTRSGRKNRASEQREDFFGHRKAVGADAPAATFGAHLCAVRICFSRLLREKQYSYPAQLSVKRDCQGGSPVPLDRVLPTFARTKVGPRRVGVLTKPCKRLRDADRQDEMIALIFAVNPSVSLTADSLSLRLGHGAALICHWHIIHYRAATSLPLAQGSLWLGVASTTLSSKSRPGGRQEGRYCRSARYCSSRASSWAAVSARMALGSAARSSAGVRLPQVISTVGRPRFLPREISTWESPT